MQLRSGASIERDRPPVEALRALAARVQGTTRRLAVQGLLRRRLGGQLSISSLPIDLSCHVRSFLRGSHPFSQASRSLRDIERVFARQDTVESVYRLFPGCLAPHQIACLVLATIPVAREALKFVAYMDVTMRCRGRGRRRRRDQPRLTMSEAARERLLRTARFLMGRARLVHRFLVETAPDRARQRVVEADPLGMISSLLSSLHRSARTVAASDHEEMRVVLRRKLAATWWASQPRPGMALLRRLQTAHHWVNPPRVPAPAN